MLADISGVSGYVDKLLTIRFAPNWYDDEGVNSKWCNLNQPKLFMRELIIVYNASIAQMVERHICNVDVVGSIPAGGS
jgi:hypothetical protein